MSTSTDAKIPLPQFLKAMTSNNVPVKSAIAAAGKMYKDYNTPSKLNFLTDNALQTAGIEDAGDRKLILAAFRKAGYKPQSQRKAPKRKISDHQGEGVLPQSPRAIAGEAGPSLSSPAKSPAKRRKRAAGKNEFLPTPDAAFNEVADPASIDFNEVTDEHALEPKLTVVNRAPVMAAWATVVAERLGFKRSEALSIASAYTEMNALSKGVSIGKYRKGRDDGMEASRGGSQPYVELMGRRVPLFQTQSEEWRALSQSQPVSPLTAHGYISRSLRQNMPYVIGSLRLLAESYPVEELKEKAWVLYTMFRPELDGWGKRSELSCAKILGLRKKDAEAGEEKAGQRIVENESGEAQLSAGEEREGNQMSLEEYEAALDDDHTFDNVDLDFTQQGRTDAPS